MEIGQKVAQKLLIVFNLMFLVLGIILMVVGALVTWKLLGFHERFGVSTQTIPLLVIVLGCLVFVLSFLGFLGAIKNDNCISLTYSILMLTLLSFQVLLVVFMYTDENKLNNLLELSVKKAWEKQEFEKDPGFMDTLQSRLKCCGVNGPADYGPNMNSKEPQSCYKKSIRERKIFHTGCKDAVKSFVKNYLVVFKSILITIAGLEILVFTLGCYVSGQPDVLDFLNDLD